MKEIATVHCGNSERLLHRSLPTPWLGRCFFMGFGATFMAAGLLILVFTVTQAFSLAAYLLPLPIGLAFAAFGWVVFEAAFSQSEIRMDTATRELVLVSWALVGKPCAIRHSMQGVVSIQESRPSGISGGLRRLALLSAAGEARDLGNFTVQDTKVVPNLIFEAFGIRAGDATRA